MPLPRVVFDGHDSAFHIQLPAVVGDFPALMVEEKPEVAEGDEGVDIKRVTRFGHPRQEKVLRFVPSALRAQPAHLGQQRGRFLFRPVHKPAP